MGLFPFCLTVKYTDTNINKRHAIILKDFCYAIQGFTVFFSTLLLIDIRIV